MNRNSLIVISICAVFLFILVSSTNVLGYQTVQRMGRNRLHNQSDGLLFNGVESVVKKEDNLKHLFLFMIACTYLRFHLFRGWDFFELSFSVGALIA